MNETMIGSAVRKFIQSNFYTAQDADLTDSGSLLDQGIMDSTGVLELVAFLETEFGLQLADHEMVPENLDSIANITRFVERKLKAA